MIMTVYHIDISFDASPMVQLIRVSCQAQPTYPHCRMLSPDVDTVTLNMYKYYCYSCKHRIVINQGTSRWPLAPLHLPNI